MGLAKLSPDDAYPTSNEFSNGPDAESVAYALPLSYAMSLCK